MIKREYWDRKFFYNKILLRWDQKGRDLDSKYWTCIYYVEDFYQYHSDSKGSFSSRDKDTNLRIVFEIVFILCLIMSIY